MSMSTEQYNSLDEVLKLLNGLEHDSYKRARIIDYIQEKKTVAVFAYGSLMWHPFEHVESVIYNCLLKDYTKGFICEDFIYRGSMTFSGLTLGLEQAMNGTVKGSFLLSNVNQCIPFIQAFIKRETPISINGIVLDIYTYDFLPILMPDQTTIEYAITCVANTKSKFYLNKKLTIEEQAENIARAYGLSGTNFQYLDNTLKIYRELSLYDTFTPQIQKLHDKVIQYRHRLPVSDRKWLERYDQLMTAEERLEAIRLRKITEIEIGSEQIFNRLCSIQERKAKTFHRMLTI